MALGGPDVGKVPPSAEPQETLTGAEPRVAEQCDVGDERLAQSHDTVSPCAGKGTDPFPVVGDEPDLQIVPEYAVSV